MSGRIEFHGVWKSFPQWASPEAGPRTTRGMLARRAPWATRNREQRFALSDVSVEVAEGRMLGIIGANGAGKSTMLRLAAKLGRPTRGRVVVPEDTSAVLSLGDTLDMTLSGAENAYTAALVAGMPGRMARGLIPEIMAWAELEEFAHAPVRTYSDGMKLRLAFAVIAQLEPRALILDEVLAVGDLRFQEKCAARIAELRSGGTTVMFASHSLEEIAESCDEAIWLQQGSIRALGPAGEVVERYRNAVRTETLAVTPQGTSDGGLEFGVNRFGSQEVTIDDVRCFGADGRVPEALRPGEALGVELDVRSPGDTKEVTVSVAVSRMADDVLCFETSSEELPDRILVGPDGLTVGLSFERMALNAGEYSLDVGVYEPTWSHAYDYHWHAHPFRVSAASSVKGVVVAGARWQRPRPGLPSQSAHQPGGAAAG
ncbi:MAG: lipopolysaccharide transport system ATP-binding protein [Solirubrobacteraceae bacterium]|nr:lipopolysaccharide transport system ATP-binding protein [Solirubrobacteraceae bacterium]